MKVVIGMDGSKYSRWALEWIARLPLASPPKVLAVHALDLAALRRPVMAQPMIIGNRPFIQAESKRLEREAKRIGIETRDALSVLNLQGRVVTERGAPAAMILKHVRRNDLVVIGSRGLDALDRYMLGSVSLKVTQHAPCSVLVVKQSQRPVTHILLAVDGSAASDRAARFLMKQIKPTVGHPYEGMVEIKVDVLHVLPKHRQWKSVGLALVRQHAEDLGNVGYRTEQLLRFGHPADEILKAADRVKCDLIVGGAKGLGAIARFFLGSVSTRLVQHSSSSVLIVR